jgi:hypothetical protein
MRSTRSARFCYARAVRPTIPRTASLLAGALLLLAACDDDTIVCANGTCTCEPEASCEIPCGAPPCHLSCAANNPECSGDCANGDCTCGGGSTCDFACTDHNCSATCASGAHCTLHCPDANAGEQGCKFTSCAAGQATLCPDGTTTTCNAPCPEEK